MKSYQGQNRCLDYTPEVEGSPIIINDCAKAHPVVVEELADGKHTVVLHAGTKIIGVEEGPVVAAATAVSREAAAASEKPLQLLGLSTRPGAVSIGSYFTLDGDSIIFSGNRNLVVKVQNARGAAGSPVVLGGRQLSDNEFWDFTPTAGSALDPTSGFVRIGYAGDPNCANPAMCVCRFFNVLAAAGEGTVMKLGSSLDLTDCPQVRVGQGVTIRGDRRGAFDGPELRSCYVVNGTAKCDTVQTKAEEIEPMILLPEGNNDIRITGLNLTGPSRATDDPQTKAIGVLTFDANLRNIIDNNGISGWPYIGVMTKAHDDLDIKGNSKCDPNSVHDPQVRQTSALVARNFIEYNRQQNAGYGTESDWGAYPFILGNTFVSNRHAIAGGKGSAHTAYRAWNNLVLSAAPLQHDILGDKHWTHDFDMHGMGNDGFGGIGGDYVDIYENTFLGTNRHNFELRGDVCNYIEFHNNISLESQSDAVSWNTCEIPVVDCLWATADAGNKWRISSDPNQFSHSNPTSGKGALGVGDFDGDKTDDLFLATGAGWYYSPSGKAPWRFLSAKTETMGQLLLGDFDGDGRTDVVTIQNGAFVVSWGGISNWEVLNANPTGGRLTLLPSAVGAMAVGDFDGDKVPDIFWADGHTWWVSYGGTTVFKEVQTSSFHMADLRLGDFNHDGRTDVFGVGSENWQVSYAPSSGRGLFSEWQPLRKKLTDSITNLVVADFNGDGYADVATDCPLPTCWMISFRGFENWQQFPQPVTLKDDLAAVGHFRGAAATDVLTWNNSTVLVKGKCDPTHGQDTQMCISGAGFEPATHYSTQDMR
ncbi:MAG: VCBS repeat-containing protein [Terriglobales bacterium]